MSTGTFSIDNVKDAPCMTTVHSSGFVGNKVLSFKSNVMFESNTGAGDGHAAEQANFDVKTNKEVGEAAYLHDESTDEERFVSVLEKRRMEKKAEDDGYERNISPQPNAETVSSKIDNLIGNLRRRFHDEKQTRADTVKPSYSHYIFCNSVDAFLRYHEKPKVDIHYSEADGDIQGEGLYSFAVRPSRIRKRNKDNSYIPQKKANTCAVQPNSCIGTELGNSGDCSGGNSTKARNTVSAIQNTDATVDAFLHKNPVICETPSAYKASDITVSLISKCATSGNVNNHTISPTDNIETCGKAERCVAPPVNKMIGFAEMSPIIDAIAFPSNPYLSSIIPIYKVRFHTKTYDHATPLMCGHHGSDRSNDVVALPSQTQTISCDIAAMSKYRSLDRNDNHITPAFQQVTFGRGIQSMYECNSLDKNVDHDTSPFKRVTLRAESNGTVYTIDMLVNVVLPNRRLSDNAKHSLFKKQTTIEIYGLTLRQIYKVATDEALYGHSVPLVYNLDIPGDVYEHTLLLTGAFQKTKRATPIHKITSTVEKYYDKLLPQIFQVEGHAYKERHKYNHTMVPVIKRFALQEINDKVVTQDFKIYGRIFPRIYKSTSGKLRGDEKVPIDNVSTTGHSSNTMLTADSKYHTMNEVHETTNDAMIDEYDDDSPFGILSVYCNSEIHSSFGRKLEAER